MIPAPTDQGIHQGVLWEAANQRVLASELALLGECLRRAAGPSGSNDGSKGSREGRRGAEAALVQAREALPAPAAIDVLEQTFGLSPFERDIVLLCAGVELDAAFAMRCAEAQRNNGREAPTFGLALAVLDDPDWGSIAPGAPLRYWRLVELGGGASLTGSPLHLDERILHFLTGCAGLDERLTGYLEQVKRPSALPASHRSLSEEVLTAWSAADGASPPVIQLCGLDDAGKRDLAAEASSHFRLRLFALDADRVPRAAPELELLQRLWQREAALSGGALLLSCSGAEIPGVETTAAVRSWVERSAGPLFVATREPLRGLLRSCIQIEVGKPTFPEQRELWESELGPAAAALNGQLDRVISQFHLSGAAIHSACREVLATASRDANAADRLPPADRIWKVCRGQARVKLDDLAQRLTSRVEWEDLVLPERTVGMLREMEVQVRNRATVYECWGFAARSERGLGISALFSGPSGTGKTLAAEVLANVLDLDLYRIDLSQVVSKYIGETEKNLRRVFDAAEDGGAVLLFDEADALFGKRSEVKESHDRYANIEISYLLQRMEAYRGLAILTTNMKDALDPAFLRRIRFLVQFPFPDAGLRAEIWRRIFPEATPCDGLDADRLGRLNLTGGSIRNIALNAAFLAAEAGQPVRMAHLRSAARFEFAKLEKPLPESELEGWK